jgi:hypothetical protein
MTLALMIFMDAISLSRCRTVRNTLPGVPLFWVKNKFGLTNIDYGIPICLLQHRYQRERPSAFVFKPQIGMHKR